MYKAAGEKARASRGQEQPGGGGATGPGPGEGQPGGKKEEGPIIDAEVVDEKK